MSRISFEHFGKNAEQTDNYLEMAGRNIIMKDCEKHIIFDIISKLNLDVTNNVLDIGCGSGNLLIPLSFIVNEITGIDHPSSIDKLRARITGFDNISLIENNFLDIVINDTYDKIICYSVLQYLNDIKEVLFFIEKALKLLKPGGKALFADIPNISKKKRFLKSNFGKRFDKEWMRKLKENNTNQDFSINIQKDDSLVSFSDAGIIRLLVETRKMGYHSYLLDQPVELCSGYTREDLLVVKPFK